MCDGLELHICGPGLHRLTHDKAGGQLITGEVIMSMFTEQLVASAHDDFQGLLDPLGDVNI